MSTLFIAFTLLLCASNPDTAPLASKDYEELEAMIEKLKGKKEAWLPIRAYRDKAKKQANWEMLSNAYYYALYESSGTYQLIYADSMVMAAQHTTKQDIIGEAYLTKGIVYYYRRDHLRAMDNYAIANAYIAGSGDENLTHKLKYHIGLIKSYLGYYDEAISLFRQCVTFYEHGDPYGYANSLHCLALCYSRKGNIILSQRCNTLAKQVGLEIGYKKLMAHIEQLEGVNLYYRSDYTAAIRTLGHSLIAMKRDKDFAGESAAYFYMGKAYKALKFNEKAIANFKKVDSIYLEKEYIRPELRENYELLIDYYTARNDLTAALPYIKRLLAIDKEIRYNFQYLSQKVHKEYDTRELEDFKQRAERQLALGKVYDTGLILGIIALVVCGAFASYRQVTAKKRYRRRFEALVEKYNNIPANGIQQKVPAPPVGDAITGMILHCLEDFEQALGFTQKELTATELAERFGTNSKYLSRVIRTYRQKNFTGYINGLRIHYIMGRLHNEHRLRQYNTPALAKEAGFASTQHFTKIFKQETGVTPAFFIQGMELKKNINKEREGAI